MNKRGFTLVELLAVIVILAIILAIAIPSITNIISNATQNAFSSDVRMAIKAINYKKLASNYVELASVKIREKNINLLKSRIWKIERINLSQYLMH